jgi:hypothetical protein
MSWGMKEFAVAEESAQVDSFVFSEGRPRLVPREICGGKSRN